jgi:hypothetical protein
MKKTKNKKDRKESNMIGIHKIGWITNKNHNKKINKKVVREKKSRRIG